MIGRKLFAILLAGLLWLSAMSVGALADSAALGDVDGDGTISSTDARLVEMYAIGKALPSDEVTVDQADINGDGKVTVTDARILLQYYAQVFKNLSDTQEMDAGTLTGDFFSFSEATFNPRTNEITVTVMYDTQKAVFDGVFYVSYPSDKLELALVAEEFPRDPYNHLSSMSNAQVNIAWDEGVVAVGFMDARGDATGEPRAIELTFRAKTSEAFTCPIAVWADYIMAVADPNDLRRAVRYTGSRETAVTRELAMPAVVITPPTQNRYAFGEALNLEGGRVTYTFPDGRTEDQAVTSDMVSGFDNSQPGVQRVTIACGGASVTYEVEVAEPIVSFGDVDGDGDITSTDARLILQYYAVKITANDLNTAAADVDADGSITSTDARLVLQYYAGKIPFFPVLAPPTYDGYPDVPDFGAIYGVPEAHRALEEDGMYVEYSYEDIEQADNGQGILDEYAWVLEAGFGFALYDTTIDGEDVPHVWYANEDDIFIAIGLWENKLSIRVYDRLPLRYSYPAYGGYPTIPDFGAMFNVAEAGRSYDEYGVYVEYVCEEDIMEAYMALLTKEFDFRYLDSLEDPDRGFIYFYESPVARYLLQVRRLPSKWIVYMYDAYQFPTYSGFPGVPDFGALHNVPQRDGWQEEDTLSAVYTYQDIAQVDPTGQVITNYVELLMGYGFEAMEADDENSLMTIWFAHAYEPVVVAVSLQEDYMEVYMFRQK